MASGCSEHRRRRRHLHLRQPHEDNRGQQQKDDPCECCFHCIKSLLLSSVWKKKTEATSYYIRFKTLMIFFSPTILIPGSLAVENSSSAVALRLENIENRTF